ncbi:MAG: hypothetical protein ACP5E3_00720 [Bacteroidales bacterium]
MPPTRKYRFRDAEMLMASQVILLHLKNNQEELSLIRPKWNEQYISQLISKVDNAIDNYLGLDKKMSQREATLLVLSLMEPAYQDLSMFKTQIEVDFKEDATEILTNLGFTKYFQSSNKLSQENLIRFLTRFKGEFNSELEMKLLRKGMSKDLIERLIEYGDKLLDANTQQEFLKSRSAEFTAESVKLFNEIYTEIIGICKIASQYYKSNQVKKQMFIFKEVVDNLSSSA